MNQKNTDIAAHIPFDGLINARHLGGYPTVGGALTLEKAFVRCENPENLTPEDLDRLCRFGIRTAIDLRSPEEVQGAPNPMTSDSRFTYRNIPVFSTDASPEALTKSGIPMGDLYIYMLDHCRSSFQKIFTEILNTEGGVLFHCTAGKDRTGVLSALLLLLAGVDEETVTQEYCYTQVLLAPLVEKLKSTVPEGSSPEYIREMLAARPEFIQAAIRYVKETYGSAEGYLSALGFRPEQIDALRRRLTGQVLETEKGA